MDPLVSVIIAYYNDLDFIEETLKSVYAQTYKNFEIIVVDDCSPNIEAKNFIYELSLKYGFKLIRHEKNLGSARAIQTAFEYSSGEYIVSTGQDDPILPDKIEYQLNKLIANNLDCLTCSGKTPEHETGKISDFESINTILEEQKKGQNFVV